MREESAISLLSKLPETKSQIATFVRDVRELILGAELEQDKLLEFAARIKAIQVTTEKIRKDILIDDVILEIAEKYLPKKSFDKGNANFRIQNTGVKYHYGDCGDAEYAEIMDEYEKINEKKKRKEAFLKNITDDSKVYGKDGTMLTPPPMSATTKVVITLK